MSQCCLTGIEHRAPPWEAVVVRLTVRELESWHNHNSPRYCTQKDQSHLQWSAVEYSPGTKRAERESSRSSEFRGFSSFRLHFLEGLLIYEQRWIGFSICWKKKPDMFSLFIVIRSFCHFQTHQRKSTHIHKHQLSRDPSVDIVRIVVSEFLFLSF
jgi:hypothetical protein